MICDLLLKIILPPADNLSCPLSWPVLALRFQVKPAFKVMLPEACRLIEDSPSKAELTLIAPAAVEVPRMIFTGSRLKVPPAQPARATPSTVEFNESTLGALISTLPPLPPCDPPATEIRLPGASLKALPDCTVMVPPELTGAALSPCARICELAPKFTVSLATNSMSPFCPCTESA